MNRILHISPNNYPSLNKEEHHTKKIWKELSSGFDEYHVVARSQSNSYTYSVQDNIHLHLLPKISKKSKSFFFTSFWIFRIIKQHNINYLLSQCPLIGGFSGVLASKFYGIPIMLEIHGDVYFKYLKSKKFRYKPISFLIKYTLNNATRIRSLSSSMNNMLEECGINNNIVIIPNRVNLNLFNNRNKDYSFKEVIKIVSVGRFVPQKGFDIAIEAIKKLSVNYPIELYLIGGGQLYEMLRQKALGFPNIKLFEWMPQNELSILLKECDIYIQPSIPNFGEAMPRTLLEAMAMQLPIITTRVAAIPGIFNSKNSFIINPHSTEELIDAIRILIENPEKRKEIALAGYSDVQCLYEWNNVFRLYKKELLSMINS